MGTVLSESNIAEPLLATGTPGTTDFTFRQIRQFAQAIGGGVLDMASFKVTQRGAGANLSVDVADGAAWVIGSTDATYDGQQKYGIRGGGSTTNLASITAPAGATRRDMVVLRAYDEGDAPGPGRTAAAYLQYIKNAAETTTPEAAPANSLILAYVDVTVGAVSITNSMITDVRPILSPGGQRAVLNTATVETTTSAAYTKLTTPDQVPFVITQANDILRFRFKAQWKVGAAANTQYAAAFIKNLDTGVSTQLKFPVNGGAPTVSELSVTSLGTFYSHLATRADTGNTFGSLTGSVADVSEVTTGLILGQSSSACDTIEVYNLPAGRYELSVQFKTTGGSTISVRNRTLWAEVIPFA